MAELVRPPTKHLVLITVAVEVEVRSQTTARLEAYECVLKAVEALDLPLRMKLIPGLCHSTVSEIGGRPSKS